MSSFHVTVDNLTYILYLSNKFYIKLNDDDDDVDNKNKKNSSSSNNINITAGIFSSDSMQKQKPLVKYI
jgi:hypothetical protein